MGVYKVFSGQRAGRPLWLQVAATDGVLWGKYHSDAPLLPAPVPRVVLSVELRQRYDIFS